MRKVKVKFGEKLKVDIKFLALVVIVVLVAVYFGFLRNQKLEGPSMGTVKCIASKSTIYISTGCHVCVAQEKLFGENFKYLNIVDCLIEGEKCAEANVTHVPAWNINGEWMAGLQQIEKLINLTGCGQQGNG